VRYIEPRAGATRQAEGLGTPDILLLHCEEVAVIDNLSGRLYLIVYADPATPRPTPPPSAPGPTARAAALRRQRAAGEALRAAAGERGFAKADYLAPCFAPRTTSPPATACRCRSASA
jgi:anthranilate synthase component 1